METAVHGMRSATERKTFRIRCDLRRFPSIRGHLSIPYYFPSPYSLPELSLFNHPLAGLTKDGIKPALDHICYKSGPRNLSHRSWCMFFHLSIWLDQAVSACLSRKIAVGARHVEIYQGRRKVFHIAAVQAHVQKHRTSTTSEAWEGLKVSQPLMIY